MSEDDGSDLEALLEVGIGLICQGLPIVACNGKRPIGNRWQHEEIDEELFTRRLRSAKQPAIGLRLGPTSGYIDIETDGPDEEEAFQALFEGCEQPDTPTFQSTRGKHHLYQWDDRLAEINKACIYFKADKKKVGVRLGAGEKGAQSIIPPSKNRTWIIPLSGTTPTPLPEAVIERLLGFAAKAKRTVLVTPPDPELDTDANYLALVMDNATKNMNDQGDGSKRLFACACRLAERNVPGSLALDAIRIYESRRPFPKAYSDEEILRRVEDASNRPDVMLTNRTFNFTDMGNAERFTAHFGANARYIHIWKKWLVFDNVRWKLDDTGEVIRLAKRVVKRIILEAAQTGDEDLKETVKKWAKTSEGRGKLEAMLALAQSEPPIPITYESLDSHPWLLNCNNGTLNLRTGELQPHDRGDLLTKTTGVDYPDEPGVDCPLFMTFLNRIFAGDQQLIDFVQRLMGLALVGQQLEHLLPVFHGSGANGKSVFMAIMQKAMGDYAMTAPQGLLMTKRFESHPTEVADLFRKRLVVISETKDGQSLDEGLVKALTGGDRIRARRMREDHWEFEPSHLPIVVTNHRPDIRGDDNGIWRRIRLVPFDVTIPLEEQDPHLTTKLERELPGILRWMVEGCLKWQEQGLNDPQAVVSATQQYREDSDILQPWIDDQCVLVESAKSRSLDLYTSYADWCQKRGETHVSHRVFGERLGKRFETKRASKGMVYVGIGLVSDTQDKADVA